MTRSWVALACCATLLACGARSERRVGFSACLQAKLDANSAWTADGRGRLSAATQQESIPLEVLRQSVTRDHRDDLAGWIAECAASGDGKGAVVVSLSAVDQAGNAVPANFELGNAVSCSAGAPCKLPTLALAGSAVGLRLVFAGNAPSQGPQQQVTLRDLLASSVIVADPHAPRELRVRLSADGKALARTRVRMVAAARGGSVSTRLCYEHRQKPLPLGELLAGKPDPCLEGETDDAGEIVLVHDAMLTGLKLSTRAASSGEYREVYRSSYQQPIGDTLLIDASPVGPGPAEIKSLPHCGTSEEVRRVISLIGVDPATAVGGSVYVGVDGSLSEALDLDDPLSRQLRYYRAKLVQPCKPGRVTIE
jgi:hypothetical protein